MIGANREVSSVNDASRISALEHDGTLYVIWRESSADEWVLDDTAVLMMSSSTDGSTWTTPVECYSTSYDVYPAGLTHNGSEFVLAVSVVNSVSTIPVTQIVTSADCTSFSSPTTVTWDQFWAWPSDFQYDNGTYYLIGTVEISGVYVGWLRTSTDLSSWTDLGNPDQRNEKDNVWPRIQVDNGTVYAVMREGIWNLHALDDNIIYSIYDGSSWTTELAVSGATGNPDLLRLPSGEMLLAYHDVTINVVGGVWAWAVLDTEWKKRGVFSQDARSASGGTIFAWGNDFAVLYSTRVNPPFSPGNLYFRDFTSTGDEVENSFKADRERRRRERNPAMYNFLVELSIGNQWVAVSDGRDYYMGPEDFGDKAYQMRRITAQSPFFDGTYLVHSVKENVSETLSIHVLGSSQNQVTENILLLEEIINQPSFRIRMTMGDHRETWKCQRADYTIQRGHVMMHSTRAVMKIQVSRFPDVSYEVI